ncbi:hypothetical protein SDC9_165742 [bioreactor metagenome]|uniref:Uncharacterized protein n=1 Tax=bioreactor metagenome TaxID=1076179 RepID=A0A645FXE9_9ZZZZ
MQPARKKLMDDLCLEHPMETVVHKQALRDLAELVILQILQLLRIGLLLMERLSIDAFFCLEYF